METSNNRQNQGNRENQYDDSQANEPLQAGGRDQDMNQDGSRSGGQSLSGSQNRDAGQEWGNELDNDSTSQSQEGGAQRDNMNSAAMGSDNDALQRRDSSFSDPVQESTTANSDEAQNMTGRGDRHSEDESWGMDIGNTGHASSRSRNDDRNQTV